MKKQILAFASLFFALPAFAAAIDQPIKITAMARPLSPNTIIREHSSLKEGAARATLPKRTTDYPTQIVRMEAELKGPPQNCDEVFQKIDEFFNDHITYDRFFYNTINYCVYDPNTNFAKKFIINSYFDPLDDEAITYLETYLAQHNGRDLLGSTFHVENAQGLIVSLNIDSGLEDSRNASTLLRLQHDNSSHYFTSNYAMQSDLISDVRQRFYSNDPGLILPFIDKWFFTSGWIYERVLKNSDYVELQPELIFLMDKNPKIFTPFLRLYYAHHCSKYASRHCL
ncbi:hypothetical protein AQUSIP_10310 [Aquicella siphonis]|uniref:Uncharacterized protein n=1 Tax=Aquicella siphonis TaxID=254247 RepID=A0A5E4PGZ8_9COXI|nr:Lpg0189 family type II secretion system effector [Aquicella siphonis]VVC75737.1 hypothetical protein AQUSIP_10310 [Aquicella siphonis]